MSDLATRLARTLASFDDGALGALASVGLLRRARKDFEKGEASSYEEVGEHVRVQVGDGTVTMPDSGPAAARCTCPATGVCRHILIATLFLQQKLSMETAQTGPAPSMTVAAASDDVDSLASSPSRELAAGTREELLGFDTDSIIKWVGRKALRDAMRLLHASPSVEISEAGAVLIRFPDANVECRYFPGAGLAGMITTAANKVRDAHLAAAVIAWQRHHGVVHVREDSADPRPIVLQAAEGSPRTRQQVVQSTQALLEEMVTVGLAHLSGTVRDRLRTLGISATGVNLPRLSLSLKALAEEVSALLKRDAQADDTQLFISMARTYALCAALATAGDSAPAWLVGRHRSHYDPIGKLELTGLAAYAWRTKSGYRGLTLLFWDTAGKRWCTWSDSRPLQRDPLFNPVSRFDQDLPWQGAASARQMSRSRVKMLNALRNDQGRLSASEQCQALSLGPSDPATTDFGDRLFTDWAALRRYVASIQPTGLIPQDPLNAVVVLKPSNWGRRQFQKTDQTFVWDLFDEQGEIVALRLPFEDLSQSAIETLEQISPQQDGVWGIVGRVVANGHDIWFTPFTLFKRFSDGSAIQNLGLEGKSERVTAISANQASISGEASTGSPLERDDDDAEDADLSFPDRLAFTKEWSLLEDHLQHLAESGVRRINAAINDAAIKLAASLSDHGLSALANFLLRCNADTGRAPGLLQARYISTVYSETAARLAIEPGSSG